jgi:hypothetical protein
LKLHAETTTAYVGIVLWIICNFRRNWISGLWKANIFGVERRVCKCSDHEKEIPVMKRIRMRAKKKEQHYFEIVSLEC